MQAVKGLVLLCKQCSEGNLDIIDQAVNGLKQIEVNQSTWYQLLLRGLVNSIAAKSESPSVKLSAQAVCLILYKYDKNFNDWSDYTFCLELYVKMTKIAQRLDDAKRRLIANGLYGQLSMCGRELGDSWSTTDAVYGCWHDFATEFWPNLQEAIQRDSPHSAKQEAMLGFLKPGGDFKKFLPR